MTGHFGPGFGPGIGPVDHGWGWTLMGWIPFLLFVALAALIVWAVLRATSRPAIPATVTPIPPPPPGPAPRDPALEQLRIRYARGEVDRAEFVQRSRDLGEELGEAPPPADGG
jgi:putative membrane protein